MYRNIQFQNNIEKTARFPKNNRKFGYNVPVHWPNPAGLGSKSSFDKVLDSITTTRSITH